MLLTVCSSSRQSKISTNRERISLIASSSTRKFNQQRTCFGRAQPSNVRFKRAEIETQNNPKFRRVVRKICSRVQNISPGTKRSDDGYCAKKWSMAELIDRLQTGFESGPRLKLLTFFEPRNRRPSWSCIPLCAGTGSPAEFPCFTRTLATLPRARSVRLKVMMK